MMSPKIIEGYGNLGSNQFWNRFQNRKADERNLKSKLATVTAERDNLQRVYNSVYINHSYDIPNLKNKN